MIVEPEEAVAPLILPLLVPNVQLKLLAILADNATLALVPLHIVAVVALVNEGAGLTVTAIV